MNLNNSLHELTELGAFGEQWSAFTSAVTASPTSFNGGEQSFASGGDASPEAPTFAGLPPRPSFALNEYMISVWEKPKSFLPRVEEIRLTLAFLLR